MLSLDTSGAVCLLPLQERAYSMLASKAFVHQYQKYGLGEGDFQECFAHVEDIAERYQLLA
jgi:tubulin delta